MISVTPARRRAEEFAALVDSGGEASGTRHGDLVELVTVLRGTPLVAPRPEFVTELRAALMAEADVALAPVDGRLALPAHTRTRRDRRVAIAVGTIALVGAGSSMAVAAQNALPGDALYPVKRVIEGAQTTIQVDEISKGEVLLANASGRLDEVAELRDRNTPEGIAALPDTLDEFADQSLVAADTLLDEYDRTGDRRAITELRDFTGSSMDTLVELGTDLPSLARGSLERAAQVLTQIDDRAAAVCPECTGGIDEVPPMFLRSFSDGLISPTTSTAPPVVIVPVTPRAPAPKTGGSTPPGGGADTPALPAETPETGTGGSGGGTGGTGGTDAGGGSGDDGGTTTGGDGVRDLTKKLLGPDRPTSGPQNPIDQLTDEVIDPLLGDLGGDLGGGLTP
jgi:hypothetical protein